MSCIAHASYTMKADIYSPRKIQDVNSGTFQNVWTLSSTINCLAKGIVRDTISQNSSAVDIKNYLTAVSNIVKVRTANPISSEDRVVNVRNASGTIWSESGVITTSGGVSGATIFEPRGSTPIIDFDGRVLEYETVLYRQEIQTLETE